MSTSVESIGPKKTIAVRELITFEEALQRLPEGHVLRTLHHSQLDKQMKTTIAVGLLPDGIGVVGHETMLVSQRNLL